MKATSNKIATSRLIGVAFFIYSTFYLLNIAIDIALVCHRTDLVYLQL